MSPVEEFIQSLKKNGELDEFLDAMFDIAPSNNLRTVFEELNKLNNQTTNGE